MYCIEFVNSTFFWYIYTLEELQLLKSQLNLYKAEVESRVK